MTDPATDPEAAPEQIYTPFPGERQLTLRALAAGGLLGGLVAGMNIYLGLQIGWSVGGSLIAAILSFAFFRVLFPDKGFGVLETNIAQTAGAGAGTMASAGGMLAPIPALFMLGYEIEWYELLLWSLSIAYLGVMFAAPLRRQYVVIEKLRFPSGTATANTIVAMFAEAGEAVAKARALLWTLAIALAFTVAKPFWEKLGPSWWPALDHVPLDVWFGGAIAAAGAWGFSLYLGPMLFGAGGLMGMRVSASLLAGAIVGWAILGPFAQSQGWAPADPMIYHDKVAGLWGPRGWILWPGVAIMVADALASLALSWRTFVTAFTRPIVTASDGLGRPRDPETIPNSWWVIGLALASASTTTVAWLAFDIPPHLSVIAIALSAILANVAVRSTGETDINPIGGMGKVTQLVYGALSPAMSTNLLAAGITGAGASQAGDMMQDLKTGYLLGASPRQQFKAQLIGILAGVGFAVGIFFLFRVAYGAGNIDSPLPQPAAHAWRAMAEVLSKGLGTLPPNAVWAALGGLVFGAGLPIIRKLAPRTAPYLPSGLAFGIAFIVQAYFSLTMFLGAVALLLWQARNKEAVNRFLFAVTSGLIAGEGLGGIINAILKMLEQALYS
jgi:putative OPT family oligopeptide transporter